MLVMKTYEETGGVLKSLLQGFLKRFENFSTMPSEVKTFVKKIKGRTLGRTLKAQADIPLSVTFI